MIDSLVLEYWTLEILRFGPTRNYAAPALELQWNKTWNSFDVQLLALSGRKVVHLLIHQILLTLEGYLRLLSDEILPAMWLEILLRRVSCEKVRIQHIILVFTLVFFYIWIHARVVWGAVIHYVVGSRPNSFRIGPLCKWWIHLIYIYWN